MLHLEAAVARGPHPSARSPEARSCLRQETLDKVRQGHARLIPWAELAKNPPVNLKISPLAAVPHKSRRFRAILDLSFQLCLGGLCLPSVNSATRPQASAQAMQQLGSVLPRIIAAMASAAPENGPIFFAKWDIKDGFWCLVVHPDDAWNFCYVLPGEPGEEPMIVVPLCLQMGWCESPAFFCSASETARDMAQHLLTEECAVLPPHPLEHLCLPPDDTLPTITNANFTNLLKLLEVYVDDFIGMIQGPAKPDLIRFTRAVLHGIHKIFPPPTDNTMMDDNDEPIALKKLQQGDGLWATSKEILGWMFDGLTRCIALPATKVTKLRHELRSVSRRRRIRVKNLQQLQGKLIHASLGIPNGKALLSPLIALVTKFQTRPYATIPVDDATKQALRDWQALLATANARPTPCTDLVPAPPDYLGYCDASRLGAGGVWFGVSQSLAPIVWRLPFPPDIQAQLVSIENPSGSISNSDLEMTGLLCQWLILESLVDLAHCHIAIGCDNTPTVAWATRLLSTKAKLAAQLLRALALRMLTVQASPLTAFHLPGQVNTMADFASRSFVSHPDDTQFLSHFNSLFKLPQDASWLMCTLSTSNIGKVYSALRTATSSMASWQQTTRNATVIGVTGARSFGPVSTPISKDSLLKNGFPSFRLLLNGQGKEDSAVATKFELAQSKMRCPPSARASNWMDTTTLSMPITPTSSIPDSNANSKPTADMTLLLDHN